MWYTAIMRITPVYIFLPWFSQHIKITPNMFMAACILTCGEIRHQKDTCRLYFEGKVTFPDCLRAFSCLDENVSGTNEVHFPQLVMADVVDKDTMKNYHIASEKINPEASRYPYCIVWTPIPVLSWVIADHCAGPHSIKPRDEVTALLA